MIFKPPQPKNLEEWLETATKGIAAPGRERITREIEAHYAEAVEAHVNQGESEQVAQENALRQLGDAKTARRRFCKEHLTKLEERRVAHLRSWPNGSRITASILLGLWLMIEFSIKHLRDAHLSLILICFGWIGTPMLMFWIAGRVGTKSKLLMLLSLQSFQFAAFCLFLVLIGSDESVPILGWIAIVGFIAISIQSLQIWKKLRKHENQAIGT